MECREKLMPMKDFIPLCHQVLDERRLQQKRATWVQNVMRILNKSIDEAVELEAKIQPYKQKFNP